MEIFTFVILIILLVWSVAMILNGILCIDVDSEYSTSNNTGSNKTMTGETAAGGWSNMFHVGWYLYLSLYGEYTFELNGKSIVIRAATSENIPSDICVWQRFRPACAFAVSLQNLYWEHFHHKNTPI